MSTLREDYICKAIKGISESLDGIDHTLCGIEVAMIKKRRAEEEKMQQVIKGEKNNG